MITKLLLGSEESRNGEWRGWVQQTLMDNLPTLGRDFVQTVVKAVVVGWALGCGLGFMVAIAIDRLPFLQRGLLPIASLTSAIPLVGVAPIAVMWFGFEWPSKAAVVVLMTFFPMLLTPLLLAIAFPLRALLLAALAVTLLLTMFRRAQVTARWRRGG